MIDVGCNLTHDSFDADREAVLQRAVDAGVRTIIVTGATAGGSSEALQLALAHPDLLYATAGVHPHHAADYDEATDSLLRELCRHDKVVAAGEAGLDYFRDFSPRNDQQRAFESQLQIGVDTGLPMFLHLRDAHQDFLAILRSRRDELSDVVVHCFTGNREELHAVLDLDCYIGITGWICDERRGTHLKDDVTEIPANRLLLETDAPYLKPRDLRPRVKTNRNEPQWLPWILDTVAACRHEHPAALAAQTSENARRFFRLPGTGSAHTNAE